MRAIAKYKGNRIGRRIVALVVVSVLVSVVVCIGLFLWLQVQNDIANRKLGIQATGYVFASAIADHVASGDRQQALSVLRSIARLPDISYALAVDAEGREIAALGSTTLLQGDAADDESGVIDLITRGSFPVAIDIVRSGQSVGRLIIVADVTGFRGQLLRAIMLTGLAGLAASLLGVAVAFQLQRRITGPIISLTQAMRQIRSARDYRTKVEHMADDETGLLVDSFNDMMSEISFRDNALERLAYCDPLTGLANRQQFQLQLEKSLADKDGRDICAALFLLDLDEFKQTNDTFGHTVGDALLLSVAAALKQESNSNLHLARLGGDEFAVIAADVQSESEVQDLLPQIVAAFFKPFNIMEREIFVSASIGVAMIPRDGNTVGELLRHADLALYKAKREGRGRVEFFRPALDQEVQEHTILARDLRHAIKHNELESHYQPQVDLGTGVVSGFECLIRWKHAERGYVPPSRFIPIAEHSGLICDTGLWMLRECCNQARKWLDEGCPERQISVNVSAAQVLRSEFHLDVERVLNETGLPASLLCLELTESLFAANSSLRLRHMLEALNAKGVQLALDDFGTGYSSLSYLEKLPFDKVKIDQAFVSGIERDRKKRGLLSGIVELVHALDMSVVAEGAETDGEVVILRQLKVDQVQGFAFCKPVESRMATAAADSISRSFNSRFGPSAHAAGYSGLQNVG